MASGSALDVLEAKGKAPVARRDDEGAEAKAPHFPQPPPPLRQRNMYMQKALERDEQKARQIAAAKAAAKAKADSAAAARKKAMQDAREAETRAAQEQAEREAAEKQEKADREAAEKQKKAQAAAIAHAKQLAEEQERRQAAEGEDAREEARAAKLAYQAADAQVKGSNLYESADQTQVFPDGCEVRVVDKPGFSGKTGVVSDFDEDSGRYEVDLQLTPGGRVTRVSFRGRNLEAVVQRKPQAPPPVPEAEPAPEPTPPPASRVKTSLAQPKEMAPVKKPSFEEYSAMVEESFGYTPARDKEYDLVMGYLYEDVEKAKNFLPNIRAPRFGSIGQILEWRYEYEEVEPGHRHLSHLYGLHPSHQFSPIVNKTLAEAAKVSLDRRIREGSGDTGWSRTWT